MHTESRQFVWSLILYTQIENGLPALQIYKGGALIGNFVRLSDQLGDDFYAGDVEAFLQE